MKKEVLVVVIGLAVWSANCARSAPGETASAAGGNDAGKANAGNPPPRHPMTPPQRPGRSLPAVSGLGVSFKLDTRLTKGLYMGDRWVSPPTFTQVGLPAQELIVEAVAYVVDAKGRPTKLLPRWTVGDKEMVTVTPAEGNAVKIAIKCAGESSVEIASLGLTRKLSIKALARGGTIQADITQHAATRRPGAEVQAGGRETASPTQQAATALPR